MKMRDRPPQLEILLSRLSDVMPLQAAILFGSRARDAGRPDSDWDLCLVIPDEDDPADHTPYRIHQRLGFSFGLAVDIVVARRSDLVENKDDVGSLAYDIARDGVVVLGTLEVASAP